jgi:hypothetical protein
MRLSAKRRSDSTTLLDGAAGSRLRPHAMRKWGAKCASFFSAPTIPRQKRAGEKYEPWASGTIAQGQAVTETKSTCVIRLKATRDFRLPELRQEREPPSLIFHLTRLDILPIFTAWPS